LKKGKLKERGYSVNGKLREVSQFVGRNDGLLK